MLAETDGDSVFPGTFNNDNGAKEGDAGAVQGQAGDASQRYPSVGE
jgi:hypothetical protein